MDYIKIDEVAVKWGITPRRLQTLCAQGKIEGATRFGRAWMIPKSSPRPADGRTKAARREKMFTDMPMPRKTPFLHMTNLYNAPGWTSYSRTHNPHRAYPAHSSCRQGESQDRR